MKRVCFLFLAMILSQVPSFGFERRPNTSLQLPFAPQKGDFFVEDAFPGLEIPVEPIGLKTPDGFEDRIYLFTKGGIIYVIKNIDSGTPTIDVFMDISGQVDNRSELGFYDIAFHPEFKNNGTLFSSYATWIPQVGPRLVLSKFQLLNMDYDQGDPSSEIRLIEQLNEHTTHQGGALLFGNDRYLYWSVGDEGIARDAVYQNSQRIDKDFFSAVLRLDIDNGPGSLSPNEHFASLGHYSIPSDNPFIGLTEFNGVPVNPEKIRTEFFAVGFRNPWRMTMDRPTGVIFIGDVGEQLIEEVDILKKGANYGWNFFEGTRATGWGLAPFPEDFGHEQPIYEYPHNGNSSVIGGIVYRGDSIPSLYEKYVFADFSTTDIFALSGFEVGETVEVEKLTNGGNIAALGEDPTNGDVLMVDVRNHTLTRLVSNDSELENVPPFLLSETGIFSEMEELVPSDGIVAYDVNVPLWSDFAVKQRWFSIPEVEKTIQIENDGSWEFPEGSVWVKHFGLELERGNSETLIPVETRVLVEGESGLFGFTYQWREDGSDAEIVPADGSNREIEITDGGSTINQNWKFPSRSDCLRCHTKVSGGTLGFSSKQLEKSSFIGGTLQNQLEAFFEAGYFEGHASNPELVERTLADQESTKSLSYKVRSYLNSNCSHCHQPGGPALGSWDARISTPLDEAGIVNGELRDNQGSEAQRVIVPGDLEHSEMLRRISTLENDRMPPLATHFVDEQAKAMLEEWIMNMVPEEEEFASFQAKHLSQLPLEDQSKEADPDSDGFTNYDEFVSKTLPAVAGEPFAVKVSRDGETARISATSISNRGMVLQRSDRLGAEVDWEDYEVMSWFEADTQEYEKEMTLPTGTESGYFRVVLLAP